MEEHKTIFDSDFELQESDFNYDYQKNLTTSLDNIAIEFDQNIINEIVLWKVNRYANIKIETLELINSIDNNSDQIEDEKTKIILKALLKTSGIGLPMASTILRFKNKKVYQIIDQRVYRIIYKSKKLKLPQYPNDKNLDMQIDLYIQYLQDLKGVCKDLNIPFDNADRILFMADRRVNKALPLDNY